MFNSLLKKGKIILKVTEICKVSYINEDNMEVEEEKDDNYALRTYSYLTNSSNATEAISECLNSFDIDNVFNCNDEFDGECLTSEILSIEVYDVE